MVQKYAILNSDNEVVNVILLDEAHEYKAPDGHTIISVEDTPHVDTSYVFDGEVFERVSNQPDITVVVTDKIRKAREQFISLIDRMAAENVIAGITAAGKTKLIADTVQDLVNYGSTGSLYEAINELDRIEITPEMSPYLTAERRESFRAELLAILASL